MRGVKAFITRIEKDGEVIFAAEEKEDGTKLLEKVGDILESKLFVVDNIDATIIAQAPKMRPYIDTMRENIAKALKIPVSLVNVKATTEEGLGFTGAGEGIAAHAVCLLSSLTDFSDSGFGGCGGCGGCGMK